MLYKKNQHYKKNEHSAVYGQVRSWRLCRRIPLSLEDSHTSAKAWINFLNIKSEKNNQHNFNGIMNKSVAWKIWSQIFPVYPGKLIFQEWKILFLYLQFIALRHVYLPKKNSLE
jgi:hypothetical protein